MFASILRSLAFAALGVVLLVSGCSEQDFTVNLDQPLRVMVIDPSGETEGVRVDAKVRVTFSENVREGSLNEDTFYLERLLAFADQQGGEDEGGGDNLDQTERIAGTISYDADSYTATFQPEGLLDYSARYRAVVTTGVERSRAPDATLPMDVRWVFQTRDPPHFHLVAFEPGAGTNGAAIDSTLRAIFNLPVAPASVTTETFRVSDADTGAEILGTFAVAEREVVFAPAAPLGYSRHVRVELTEGITAIEVTSKGGFLEHPIDITFRTVHPPMLRMVSADPGPGSRDILLSTAFSIRFSEALDPASATEHSVLFEDVTDPGVPAALLPADPGERLALHDDGAGFTFTPASILDFSRTIRVTLAGSADPGEPSLRSSRATDQGGYLAADVIFEVRTIPPPDLWVVATEPGAGSVGAPIDSTISVLFSEPIEDFTADQAEASAAMRIENVSGALPQAVVGDYVLSPAGDEVTFAPAEPLAYGAVYQVTLSADIRSLRATPDGGVLGWDLSYRFETEPAPALLLIGHFPSGEAMNVARLTPEETPTVVSLLFSEDVDSDSADGNVAVFHLDGTPVPGNVWTAADTILFEPALPWNYSAQYQVTLAGGIRSTRGGYLGREVSFIFRVIDPPPLLIADRAPSAGAHQVLHSQPIVIHLSEGVAQESVILYDGTNVADASLFVRDAGGMAIDMVVAFNAGDAPTNADLIGDDNVITITPAAGMWPYSQDVVVRMTTDIRSDRANELGGERHGYLVDPTLEWTFRVEQPPELIVVSTDPAEGDTGVALGGSPGGPISVVFSKAVDLGTLAGKAACGDQAGSFFIAKGAPTASRAIVLATPTATECPAPSTISGVFCVSSDGRTVSVFPDANSECVDGAPNRDWDLNQSYSIVLLRSIGGAGDSTLRDTVVRTFDTQVSGLVQRIYLSPTLSVLGDVIIDFSKPIDDVLSDGTTAVAPIADQLFALESTDQFGNRIPLPFGVAFTQQNGAACTLGAQDDTGCDRAVLTVTPSAWDCRDAQQRLHYQSEYRVWVASSLRAADGDPTSNEGSGFAVIATGNAPWVGDAVADNGVVSCDLAAGTCSATQEEGPRVPVNSAFQLSFSEAMLGGSLRAADPPDANEDTVVLRNVDADCLVPITLTQLDATSLVVEVAAAEPGLGGPCDSGVEGESALRFGTSYELIVRGRSAGNPVPTIDPCDPAVTPGNPGTFLEACTTDGRYLDGDFKARFETSSANSVFIAAAVAGAGEAACNSFIPALFAREVDTSALNNESFRVTKSGTLTNGLYYKSGQARLWVTYAPSPNFCRPDGDTIIATVTPLMRDLLGNPFPASAAVTWISVGELVNDGEITSLHPPQGNSATDPEGSCDIATGAFVPPLTQPAEPQQVAGHQRFAACGKADPTGRVLPSSVDDINLRIEDIEDGAGLPVLQSGDLAVAFGDNSNNGDSLIFAPQEYFKAGRRYRFYPTDRLSTIYNVNMGCSSFYAFSPVFFQGEKCAPGGACAPTVAVREPVAGAVDVSSTTRVTITFSEPVDPASFRDPATDASTGFFTLTGPGGPVPGTFTFESTGGAANLDAVPACPGTQTITNPIAFDRVIFTPSEPLAAGTHTVALTDAGDALAVAAPCPDPTVAPLLPDEPPRAVTDTAGNCLAATADWTFDVDAVQPAVIALLPASPADSDADVVLTFSEPMRPETLTEVTYRVNTGLACFDDLVRGCLHLESSAAPGIAGCELTHSCDRAVLNPIQPYGLFEHRDAIGLLDWSVGLSVPPVSDLAGNLVNLLPGVAGIDFDGTENVFATVASAPHVLCSDPVHDPAGAFPVNTATPLTLAFNEPMTGATLAGGLRIENVCTGTLLTAIDIAPMGDAHEYSILPQAGWPADALIDVTVSRAAMDDSGIPLVRAFHVRFKTTSPGGCP